MRKYARVVLLDNHLPAIRLVVYKRYNRLPNWLRRRFTVEELVHDCVVMVRRKQADFDPSRSKFITFVYLVVQTYLSKRIQYEQRSCRTGVEVVFDTIHRSTDGGVMDGVDMMDATRLFMRMYALLPSRLRGFCRLWFLEDTMPAIRLNSHRFACVLLRRAMQEADVCYKDMALITSCPDTKAFLLRQANEFEDMGDDE